MGFQIVPGARLRRQQAQQMMIQRALALKPRDSATLHLHPAVMTTGTIQNRTGHHCDRMIRGCGSAEDGRWPGRLLSCLRQYTHLTGLPGMSGCVQSRILAYNAPYFGLD